MTQIINTPKVLIPQDDYNKLKSKASIIDDFTSPDHWEGKENLLRLISELFVSYLRTEEYQLRTQQTNHRIRHPATPPKTL